MTNIAPKQPGFYTQSSDKVGAIPASEYDNLSNEQIRQLLNQTGSYLNKRPGNIAPVKPPAAGKVIDYGALDERFR
jgi:hypothetical protein